MPSKKSPGEKPFNPLDRDLIRSVLQPEDLPRAAEEGMAQGPVDLGDYLDEIGRGASAFAEPGVKRVVVDLPVGLYERLRRAGDACGRKPSEFVRLLLERELEGR